MAGRAAGCWAAAADPPAASACRLAASVGSDAEAVLAASTSGFRRDRRGAGCSVAAVLSASAATGALAVALPAERYAAACDAAPLVEAREGAMVVRLVEVSVRPAMLWPRQVGVREASSRSA